MSCAAANVLTRLIFFGLLHTLGSGVGIDSERSLGLSTDDFVKHCIISSNQHEICCIDLNTGEFNVLVPGLTRPVALDFHMSQSALYWTDVLQRKIYRGKLSEEGALTSLDVVIQYGLVSPEGLAVDWIAGNIYWVDSYLNQIEVAKLDGTMRTTLLAGEIEKPRVIALDPRAGILFWMDHYDSWPSIEAASMSGEGRKTIYKETDNGHWPTALTVDYLERRILWIDAWSHTIYSANYDGSGLIEVLRGHKYLSFPFAITTYGNEVYWTDRGTRSLVKANKRTGSNVTVVQRTNKYLHGLQVYHPSRQPQGPNPCAAKDGKEPCSHLCLINYNQTFSCACPHLMELGPDKRTCYGPVTPFIILSNDEEICRLDSNIGEFSVLVPGLTRPVALEFHLSQSALYWTDVLQRKIYRGKLPEKGALTSLDVVIQYGLVSPEGLAVDWIAGNIYWVDSYLNQIEVAKLDGTMRTTLLAGEIEKPRLIALDPRTGILFWSDLYDSWPSIEAASMSGEGRKTIYKETDNRCWHTGLTLDYLECRILWIDAWSHTIYSANYDGSGLIEVLRGHKYLSLPFAITTYGNEVYWTDRGTRSLVKANKRTGSRVTVVQRTNKIPFGLQVYHPSRQPQGPNPCAAKDGKEPCSHLCLINYNQTFSCACPHLMELAPDKRTCYDFVKHCIISSNQHEICCIDLNTGEFSVLVPGLTRPVALDFHLSQSALYWTDVLQRKIYRGKLSEKGALTSLDVVIQYGLVSPEGLAVDWIAGNIYWVDSYLNQIEVAKLDGIMRTTLLAGEIEKPRLIALDPRTGILFWSDLYDSWPSIEAASMSGEGRKTIYKETDIRCLHTGLTVDYLERRILWIDAWSHTIYSANYDGSGLIEVLRGHKYLSFPFAITTYGNEVYWTDRGTRSLVKANKRTGSRVTVVQRTNKIPFGLQVYHPSRQPQALNPCAAKDGKEPCSHLCLINYNHTFSCACPHLMELGSDKRTCYGPVTPFIISSNQHEICSIDLNTGEFSVLVPGLTRPVALDFHLSQSALYWTDVLQRKIYRGKLSEKGALTSLDVVIQYGLVSPEGLAVDWIAGNIYWVDSSLNQIEVAKLDGTMRTTLLAGEIKKPRFIALDPRTGILFWLDQYDSWPSIEAASMSGEGRKTIHKETDNGHWPTALTVDYLERRILWIDAWSHTIYSAKYDGSGLIEVLRGHKYLSFPFAITTYGNEVYWTDRGTRSLVKANKRTGSRVTVVQRTNKIPFGLQVYHPSRQPQGPNQCAAKDGEEPCSHLCLINYNQTFSCACPHLMDLGPDKRTCYGVGSFLLYSVHEGIGGIPLDLSHKSDAMVPVSGISVAVGIDFHADNDTIYWVDKGMSTISRAKRDQTWREDVVTNGIHRAGDIAVDWIAGNIYWTDEGFDVIVVARLNGSFPYVVISQAMDKPRAITVHPEKGFLFWTECGPYPRIVQSRLDGSQRAVLVNDDISLPNSLSIDYEENRLYWCDARANKIERINLETGQNREVVLANNNMYMCSVSVFESYIYWSDSPPANGSIKRGSKDNATDSLFLRTGIRGQLKEIKVFNRARQQGTNVCKVNNGGCQQLCLFRGNARHTCACAHGMLAEDGCSCTYFDSYLLYSERTILKSVHLSDENNLNAPIKPLEVPKRMKNVTTLTLDYRGGGVKGANRIFFSDSHFGNIQQIRDEGSDHKILDSNVGLVLGLAYHRAWDTLFWTSYTTSTIFRQNVGRSQWTHPYTEEVVIMGRDDHPRALVLDEYQSLLFWTNWNELSPSIMRVTVSGSNVVHIISSDIQTPTGLAIDHLAEKLYFSDSTLGKIERCEYDGTGRYVVLKSEQVHPFGLAVFGDYIFWTDWVRRAVLRSDKHTGGDMKVLRANIPRQPMGIVAVAKDSSCDAMHL